MDLCLWQSQPPPPGGGPELLSRRRQLRGRGRPARALQRGFGTPAACSRGCNKPRVSAVSAYGRWTGPRVRAATRRGQFARGDAWGSVTLSRLAWEAPKSPLFPDGRSCDCGSGRRGRTRRVQNPRSALARPRLTSPEQFPLRGRSPDRPAPPGRGCCFPRRAFGAERRITTPHTAKRAGSDACGRRKGLRLELTNARRP